MKTISFRPAGLGKHAAAIADQGVSSGTNFLAVLVMARGLDAHEFGVFAMAYTALTLFLGLSRSFFGIPVALASGAATAKLHGLYSESMSSLGILFVPIALAVAFVGVLAAAGNPAHALVLVVAVGVATPLVMMQDLSRYYAMARGTPGVAVLSDVVWLVGIIVLLFEGPALGIVALALWWTSIVLAALIVTIPTLRPIILFKGAYRLLRPRRGLRESVSVTVALSTGVTLVMGFLMLPFLGATGVGTIRGAGTLFGPVNTLIALLDFSVLAGMAKRPRSGDVRAVYLVTLALAVVSGAWATVLLVLPSSLGHLLLGDSWTATRTILPITSAEYVLLCVAAGIAVLFKLRDRSRPLLVNRILSSVVIVLSAVLFLVFGRKVEWMAVALLLGAIASAAGMVVSSAQEARERFPRVTNPPTDLGPRSRIT